jgi:enamine deaminase RidA (YjgF/YER057c/UK114 family)
VNALGYSAFFLKGFLPKQRRIIHKYAKHFEADYPARAAVATGLKAGALVEVSVVAYKNQRFDKL